MHKFLSVSGMVLIALVALTAPASIALAETHEVLMYNKHPDNPKERNVFVPAFLKVKPGDTIKFVATDKGHNSQSIKGMIPEGAEKWRSKLNKDFELTLTKPGVYGFKCTPHLSLGMIGVIVVEGEGWDANLEAAKAVKMRGLAKKRFEAVWAELDAAM